MPLSTLGTLQTLSDIADPGAAIGEKIGEKIAGKMTGQDTSGSIFPDWVNRGIIIIIGLLLVAAGIFSFDKVQQAAGAAASTAAKVAA